MKKVTFFALVALFTSITATDATAQANTRLTMLQATGAASDTVTNAGTAYVAKNFTGSAAAFGFQIAITKVSGTLAGTLTLAGSIDGTHYHTIDTTQTITNTTGTKYYLFILDGGLAPYTHYKATGAGMTTGVYYIAGTMIGKK